MAPRRRDREKETGGRFDADGEKGGKGDGVRGRQERRYPGGVLPMNARYLEAGERPERE